MKATGIRQFRAPVELLELPEPRALRPDEVLINVRACGMGNWDEIARNGGWDLGTRPPMALGVEAAGLVAAVGDQVDGVQPGDRVTAHSLPLREQGAWAERYIAAGEHVAAVPAGVPFDAAAARCGRRAARWRPAAARRRPAAARWRPAAARWRPAPQRRQRSARPGWAAPGWPG